VRIVGAALSDRAGEASLHDGAAGGSQASLVARDGRGAEASATITVPLIRLGDYLEEQAIGRVDLLKLDVEGSELAALRGLGERLRPEIVDAIQFEYGGTALDAGTTLREAYRLLEARGYVLAKLFPRALEVRGYRAWMEHYAYANYVALAPRRRDHATRA
jgi:Methyltransferase FkbM domain